MPHAKPSTPERTAVARNPTQNLKSDSGRVAAVPTNASGAQAKPARSIAKKAASESGAKPAAKPGAKSASPQPLVGAPADGAAAATDAAIAKAKHKLVRDSFTIPKSEYAVLDALKLRAARLQRPTKKSEVLRAGIAALHSMSDKAFLNAINGVPSLKTGRPKATSPVRPDKQANPAG